MTDVFQVTIEEIGDSLGFIIPLEIVEERGLKEGDTIQIRILPTSQNRGNERVSKTAGMYKRTAPFEREKDDRY